MSSPKSPFETKPTGIIQRFSRTGASEKSGLRRTARRSACWSTTYSFSGPETVVIAEGLAVSDAQLVGGFDIRHPWMVSSNGQCLARNPT
jgi:hypothetical protein